MLYQHKAKLSLFGLNYRTDRVYAQFLTISGISRLPIRCIYYIFMTLLMPYYSSAHLLLVVIFVTIIRNVIALTSSVLNNQCLNSTKSLYRHHHNEHIDYTIVITPLKYRSKLLNILCLLDIDFWRVETVLGTSSIRWIQNSLIHVAKHQLWWLDWNTMEAWLPCNTLLSYNNVSNSIITYNNYRTYESNNLRGV